MESALPDATGQIPFRFSGWAFWIKVYHDEAKRSVVLTPKTEPLMVCLRPSKICRVYQELGWVVVESQYRQKVHIFYSPNGYERAHVIDRIKRFKEGDFECLNVTPASWFEKDEFERAQPSSSWFSPSWFSGWLR